MKTCGEYSLEASGACVASEIHRLKCDLSALPQPGAGLRDEPVLSPGGDFLLDRVSRSLFGLGNPTIDQEAVLARQYFDRVLSDVQRRIVDLAQDQRQRRAGVDAHVAGDARQLDGRQPRSVVELHGAAAAADEDQGESDDARVHAAGCTGSVAVGSTIGITSFVPGRMSPRSRSGLYWRSSHSGMLYFCCAMIQIDSPA